MKILYSSMFIEGQVGSFEELVCKIQPEKIQLYLDTNICVNLRDFYREPNSIVKRTDSTWDELRTFLRNVEQYNLLVNYSLGVEEACRNLNNFEINKDKLNEMLNHIGSLFSMDYLQMIEHSKLVKYKPPTKDITTRQSSKLNSLSEVSRFQNLLYLNYACLLKLFILANENIWKSRIHQMLEYMDFLDRDIDVISVAALIFGYHYFSDNSKIKRMVHPSKKNVEFKIHALWNAAIDLTLPTLVSINFAKDGTVPVFVTSDERLWTIFNSMKIRMLVTGGNGFDLPPIMEADLSTINWTDEEFKITDEYFSQIEGRRNSRLNFGRIDIDNKLNKLRQVCMDLENKAKIYM